MVSVKFLLTGLHVPFPVVVKVMILVMVAAVAFSAAERI
jgi:hypothetical protein